MITNATHITVLLKEAVEALKVKREGWYVDATVGAGGHTREILAAGGKVVGLDFDRTTIEQAQVKFATEIKNGQVILLRENFDALNRLIGELKAAKKLDAVNGVLFDFGTTTNQLMDPERGLSFDSEAAELDMRLDDRLGVKAADLLKLLSVKQLTQVFQDLGGEEYARPIAKAIVELRQVNPHQLETVGALVTLISRHKPRKISHLNPATKVFQALRIAVNDELDNITRALPQALDCVVPGGRIVTIAFHEGEDRIVKQAFTAWEEQGRGKKITKKPLVPGAEELESNPRSRSAKMRVFERQT
jgi:16S rRNA (cytosine1402-N4)-methyltransferase